VYTVLRTIGIIGDHGIQLYYRVSSNLLLSNGSIPQHWVRSDVSTRHFYRLLSPRT
jgi:hypothetical protein